MHSTLGLWTASWTSCVTCDVMPVYQYTRRHSPESGSFNVILLKCAKRRTKREAVSCHCRRAKNASGETGVPGDPKQIYGCIASVIAQWMNTERWWNDTDRGNPRLQTCYSAAVSTELCFHGLMFNWVQEVLALSVGLFFLLTGFFRFSDGSQFTSFSPVAATCKKRKWSGNCLKWVRSVVFKFSTKILRCPETVLVSAEFNSCQSVADRDGLECVSKHTHTHTHTHTHIYISVAATAPCRCHTFEWPW